MRRSTGVGGPLLLIVCYYGAIVGIGWWLIHAFPELDPYWPVGGVEELLKRGADQFQPVQHSDAPVELPREGLRLAISIVCTILLMVPISWVYFITTKDKDVDRSFAQTIVVLPVIVAGIALIVHGSLALAFSLAGVVAAVRFRFTLDDPSQALYIFVSIAVGLGAGIGAASVAAVISVAFVLVTLLLWRIEYGEDLNSAFFAFLTGRGRGDREL
jgi:hypothetical protein